MSPPLDLQDTRCPRCGAATLRPVGPRKVISGQEIVRQAEERPAGPNDRLQTAPRLAEERAACAGMHEAELERSRWRYTGRRPVPAHKARSER
jgi:hypothetical protein